MCGRPAFKENGRLCQSCGEINALEFLYCTRCGGVLSQGSYSALLEAKLDSLLKSEMSDDPRVSLSIANLFRRLGKEDDALDWLRRLSEQRDIDKELKYQVHYMIGRVLSEKDTDSRALEESVENLEAALKLTAYPEQVFALEQAIERIREQLVQLEN